MSIFLIVTITIFYFLWEILTLNKEVNIRVNNYKMNSKNIKRKPLCSKSKTVFLFVAVTVLVAITTAISPKLATLAFGVIWLIYTIIRQIKIKQIKTLDNENEEYWRGEKNES